MPLSDELSEAAATVAIDPAELLRADHGIANQRIAKNMPAVTRLTNNGAREA